MKRNPLLPLLLLLITVIAVGDCLWPYGMGRTPVWPEGVRTWTGVVTEVPRKTGKSQRCVVRLVDDGSKVAFTALGDTSETVAVGDMLVFRAQIELPHNAGNPGEMDYAAYLRHQGVVGQAFCFASHWSNLGRSSSLQVHERLLIIRERLVAAFGEHLEGETLAIISAMTLGDRTHVDRSLRELYSRSGASHLLALSGLHLGILVSLLLWMSLPLRRRYGRVGQRLFDVLVFLVIWSFVWLAGLPLSLVRSATMISITFFLSAINHYAPPFHTLILTLLLMLLWDPDLLYDVGLQLSVVAVMAIVWLTNLPKLSRTFRMNREQLEIRLIPLRIRLINLHPYVGRVITSRMGSRMIKAFVSLVGISFVAQLATFPLVAHYFGRISVVGVLTSIVAIPMAYVILLGGVAYGCLWPLRGLIARGLTGCVGLLHAVMNRMVELPCATIDIELSWLGVVGVYVALLWVVYRIMEYRVPVYVGKRWIPYAAHALHTTSVALALLLLTASGQLILQILRRPEPQVIVYNRFSQSEIHLVSSKTDSILSKSSPHLVGNVLMYAGQRMAIFDHPFSNRPVPSECPPLEVDVLLVTRGCKGELERVLQYYHPRLVALDGCLPAYYRERYTKEADSSGLPVYDIHDQGALVLKSDTEQRE